MKKVSWIKDSAVFIDPTSPETNRGSYCYLSYLLASATGGQLLEEFRIADFDKLQNWIVSADHVFVALWSYPQIETCLMLHSLLKGKCRFYGYYPLIQKLGLPAAYYTEELILAGMYSYPEHYDRFDHLLLSDCDLHLKTEGEESPTVYPMFTSYGCPMGCTFCSATKNQSKRIVLGEQEVESCLDEMYENDRYGIHFTDEDFFFDSRRAIRILKYAANCSDKFKFIALGSIDSVHRFCRALISFPEDVQKQIWGVLHLIEIGLETVDEDAEEQMGKQRSVRSVKQKVPYIIKQCKTKILWLTMTFAPGETITSIARTGRFLLEHGLNPADLEDRIVTNGTVGGLGQFFQYYDGTNDKGILKTQGSFLTERPMRLLPSYLPMSFLNGKFMVDQTALDCLYESLWYWMKVYNITDHPRGWADLIDRTVTAINDDMKIAQVSEFVKPHIHSYMTVTQNAIFLALCARLGIIEEVK